MMNNAGQRLVLYESANNVDELQPMIQIPAVHIPDTETADELRSAETLGEREMVHVKIAWKAEAQLVKTDDNETDDDELPSSISVNLTTETWRDITEFLLDVGQSLEDICTWNVGFQDTECLQGTHHSYDPPGSA